MRAVLLALPTVTATTLLAVALALSGHGLDLVDESYTLSLVADPSASRDSGEIFLFGFLLHPLFEWLGQDIAVFRFVGLAGLAAASAWMGLTVASFVADGPGRRLTRTEAWLTGVVVGGSAVVAHAVGIRVPSYRSMTLLGLTFVVVGLVHVARRTDRPGGYLIGVGAWVVFTGRPTAALALVLLVPATVALMGAGVVRTVARAAVGTSVAFGVTAMLAAMTPPQLYTYLLRGYQQTQLLGGHESVAAMLGWGPFPIAGLLVLGLPLLAAAAVSVVLLGTCTPERRRLAEVVVVVTLMALSAVVARAAGLSLADTDGSGALSMALVLPLLAVLLAARRRWTVRGGPILVVLLVMPYVASLGSTAPLSHTMAQASTFWVTLVLAVVLTAAPVGSSSPLLAPTAMVCLAVPVTLLWVTVSGSSAVATSLDSGVRTSVGGDSLMLSAGDASVMSALSGVRDEGVAPGTPVLDLTGVGAGYRYQLGAGSLGRASFFGEFPGAEQAAEYALSWETCADRARAVVLYAPDNPADVSRALTLGVLDLSRDYDRIAVFSPTQGPPEWRTLRVEVLRPRPSVAQKLGCVEPAPLG